MSRASSSKLSNSLIERVRVDGDSLLTRWADIIKDLMLDWDFSQEDQTTIDELPVMSADEFVLSLRGQMEETMRRVADAINQAPTGKIVESSKEKVCKLLTEFWTTALQLGVQMRLEAAAGAASKPRPSPEGQWAKRLRQMLDGVEAEDETTTEPVTRK
jgi:hypothetical protein